MNVVWTFVVALSALYMAFTSPQGFLPAMLNGADSALSVALSLSAVYILWNGVFGILEKCGAVEFIARLCRPVVNKLFGKIDDEAAGYVALNMSANLIGVSNAATPSAVRAMQSMEKDNVTLSRAGAMLFVLNACGIQIVPTTVIGMRAELGSANPADVVLPTIISTAVSALLGAICVLLCFRKKK